MRTDIFWAAQDARDLQGRAEGHNSNKDVRNGLDVASALAGWSGAGAVVRGPD